jgi:hypothetical protein
MAKFIVEIVGAGKVEKVETIDTSTPVRAASIVIAAPVMFRRNEDRWIKVTPAGGQKSFQFVNA